MFLEANIVEQLVEALDCLDALQVCEEEHTPSMGTMLSRVGGPAIEFGRYFRRLSLIDPAEAAYCASAAQHLVHDEDNGRALHPAIFTLREWVDAITRGGACGDD